MKELIKLETIFFFKQIDAMVAPEDKFGDDSRFNKAHRDTLRCAIAGPSMMMRKDNLPKYAWMEEGLKKIMENGDYNWACNNAERGESAGYCRAKPKGRICLLVK